MQCVPDVVPWGAIQRKTSKLCNLILHPFRGFHGLSAAQRHNVHIMRPAYKLHRVPVKSIFRIFKQRGRFACILAAIRANLLSLRQILIRLMQQRTSRFDLFHRRGIGNPYKALSF